MTDSTEENKGGRGGSRGVVPVAAGLVCGVLVSYGWAAMNPPTEHKGLEVQGLGAIDQASLSTQLDLGGHKLQLRKITIMPGGQIAKHSHANRPGLVKVVRGTWVEGRADGETEYSAGDQALLEDEDTVHWFYNRGEEPATAYVCDIVPDDA